MRILIKHTFLFSFLLILTILSSCKKEEDKRDSYGVNAEGLLPANAGKK